MYRLATPTRYPKRSTRYPGASSEVRTWMDVYNAKIDKFDREMARNPKKYLPTGLKDTFAVTLMDGLPVEITEDDLEEAWNTSVDIERRFDPNRLGEPNPEYSFEEKKKYALSNSYLTSIREDILESTDQLIKSMLLNPLVFEPVLNISEDQIFEQINSFPQEIPRFEEILEEYKANRDESFKTAVIMASRMRMIVDKIQIAKERFKMLLGYFSLNYENDLAVADPGDYDTHFNRFDFKETWRMVLILKRILWIQLEKYLDQIFMTNKWDILIAIYMARRGGGLTSDLFRFERPAEKIHNGDFGAEKRLI